MINLSYQIMTKNVGIYLYDLRHPFVGLSEFDDNIARRLAAKAKAVKEQDDIRFTFIVPLDGALKDSVSSVDPLSIVPVAVKLFDESTVALPFEEPSLLTIFVACQ